MTQPAAIIGTRGELPSAIREVCATRGYVTMPELAKGLRIDVKTLRKHIDAGRLKCRLIGTGALRRRRAFLLSDIESFFDGMLEPPCPSIGTKTRLSGSSISSSTVIAFPDPPKSRLHGPSVKQKPSRRQSVGRPSELLRQLENKDDGR